jgi:hypothetical protein
MQLRRAPLGVTVGLAVGVALATLPSRGQVVEVDMRTQVFHEPSASSRMTVYTPELAVSAEPAEGARVFASYQADAVTGASEAVKAGPLLSGVPDIVSRASVQDYRHVASGGSTIARTRSASPPAPTSGSATPTSSWATRTASMRSAPWRSRIFRPPCARG